MIGEWFAGARNTSDRFRIWDADALLSSIDCMAAEDSVSRSSEVPADSVSVALGDNGDRSSGRLSICKLRRPLLKLRRSSWLGRRSLRLASILRRASQLLLPASVLDRADVPLMLDPPRCGAGNGERVARTFSVMGGLIVDFGSAFGEAVGVTASASWRLSVGW